MKMNKIQEAINEFKALQSRETNPDGMFDSAGRWYPSESEKSPCCESIRSPSRAYPYSMMLHCRSLKHVCTKYEIDYMEVKKAMNAEKPKRKVEKKIMYKKCAIIDKQIQSIFSGETYIIGKTYIEKVRNCHLSGYYAYKTKKEAEKAVFPDDSMNATAEKIIVKAEMWGNHINYGNGKYAYTYMKIIEVL